MLWAVFTVAFYGFFRVSELLKTLHWSDIALSTTKMSVTSHQSKTDPFRIAQTIQIFSTNLSTCPIKAMTIYSKIVNSINSDDPVFCEVRFNPLTQKQLNKAICHLLQWKRVNHINYAPHSFRIGAATTTDATGLPVWLTKTLG